MQTFVTDKSHHNTARSLDRQRLVKQFLEGRQIIEVLNKPDYTPEGKVTPWSRHPAVVMWRGHEHALYGYLMAMKVEMQHRGYSYEKNWYAILDTMTELGEKNQIGLSTPEWMLNDVTYSNVIATHRASLYRKDPGFYADWHDEQGDVCCNGCNYYWPGHADRAAA